MLLKNVDTSWGYLTEYSLLDKLVFPYSIPLWGKDSEVAQLLGERPMLRVQEDENFLTNEYLRLR